MAIRRGIGFLLGALLAVGWLGYCCRPGREEVPTVIRARPKFERYARLEWRYAIDVTDISMFGKASATDFDRAMSFDSRHNLYILDTYESRISVFDGQGRFVRAIGRPGQGPKDLTDPGRLVIKNDRLYIFEGFTGLKILSLEGDYIAKRVVNIENLLKLRAVGEYFYLFRGRTDPTFTRLEFLLSREGEDLAGGPQLFRSEYPPGLDGPNYDFGWHDWLLISEDGTFFFPEDNLDRYAITKHRRTGEPELVFGRAYAVRQYSTQARDRFNALYADQVRRGQRQFPRSPPIVGNMFQDARKNVWVVVGESSEDNRDPAFENTIDIFGPNGEWLSSLKSKSLSRFCRYHDGRVYVIPSADADSPRLSIEVYEITYLDPR